MQDGASQGVAKRSIELLVVHVDDQAGGGLGKGGGGGEGKGGGAGGGEGVCVADVLFCDVCSKGLASVVHALRNRMRGSMYILVRQSNLIELK